MTEEERRLFKAKKAAMIETILRKLYGDRKAEARLAEIARLAERERELQKRSAMPVPTKSEELPQ